MITCLSHTCAFIRAIQGRNQVLFCYYKSFDFISMNDYNECKNFVKNPLNTITFKKQVKINFSFHSCRYLSVIGLLS